MIKRITTLVFAFLTIVGNAVWGQETETLGGFTVTKDAATYDNSKQTLTITKDATLSTSSETDDGIIIEGGTADDPLEITFSGINVNTSEERTKKPIVISEGSNVILTLENENEITCPSSYSNNFAAIFISANATTSSTLTIKGDGSLNLTSSSS